MANLKKKLVIIWSQIQHSVFHLLFESSTRAHESYLYLVPLKSGTAAVDSPMFIPLPGDTNLFL